MSYLRLNRTVFQSLGYQKDLHVNWSLQDLQEIAFTLGVSKKGTKEEIYRRIMEQFSLDPHLTISVYITRRDLPAEMVLQAERQPTRVVQTRKQRNLRKH